MLKFSYCVQGRKIIAPTIKRTSQAGSPIVTKTGSHLSPGTLMRNFRGRDLVEARKNIEVQT